MKKDLFLSVVEESYLKTFQKKLENDVRKNKNIHIFRNSILKSFVLKYLAYGCTFYDNPYKSCMLYNISKWKNVSKIFVFILHLQCKYSKEIGIIWRKVYLKNETLGDV